MFALRPSRPVPSKAVLRHLRAISTLPNNPDIYVHNGPDNSHTLSLLPTSPPTPSLAVGTTTQIPPTPQSFKENHTFTGILHTVLSMYAIHDPLVKSQAQAMASAGGSTLGSGGQFFPSNHPSR
ncbi:hypothetical protein LTS18_009728, partial [Coniosporium uncinatum]